MVHIATQLDVHQFVRAQAAANTVQVIVAQVFVLVLNVVNIVMVKLVLRLVQLKIAAYIAPAAMVVLALVRVKIAV